MKKKGGDQGENHGFGGETKENERKRIRATSKNRTRERRGGEEGKREGKKKKEEKK